MKFLKRTKDSTLYYDEQKQIIEVYNGGVTSFREPTQEEMLEIVKSMVNEREREPQGGCMLTILLGLGFISYFFYIL